MLSNTATSGKFIHTNFLARQKVKGDDKKARKTSFKMMTMGVILMLSCFMFVWTRICVLDTGYKISEAIKTQGKYLQENKRQEPVRTRDDIEKQQIRTTFLTFQVSAAGITFLSALLLQE